MALIQRVLSPYRVPVFERLAQRPGVRLRVFFGKSIAGTKIKSAESAGALDVVRLWTLGGTTRSSGRGAVWVWHPALFWRLLGFGPDVLLCEGNSNIINNVAIYAYARLFRKRIVWWSLGQLPDRPYRGLGALYLHLVRFLERGADAWLGYSSAAGEHFRSRGFPPERVFVALNCVDTDAVFAQAEAARGSEAALRAELGWQERWIVLFVGALDEQKRVDRLLRAFADLRRSAPRAALLIVGDGGLRPELERMAGELGIEADVRFTGEVRSGVSRYFLAADAFVLPGLGGLAVPQAMAHGLPVICGPADGTERDYVQDGVTGRLLTEETEEAFCAAITRTLQTWLDEPGLARRLGENARERIRSRCNVHAFVDAVVACLRYAATAGPRPRRTRTGSARPADRAS